MSGRDLWSDVLSRYNSKGKCEQKYFCDLNRMNEFKNCYVTDLKHIEKFYFFPV